MDGERPMPVHRTLAGGEDRAGAKRRRVRGGKRGQVILRGGPGDQRVLYGELFRERPIYVA